MFIDFKPQQSNNCKLEKYIINKTFINRLGENIVNIIQEYLTRPEPGFRLFEDKIYKWETFTIHENINGHPLECVLRLMAESRKCKNNQKIGI